MILKNIITTSSKQIGLHKITNSISSGAGYSVAVIDTGVDAKHPFLAGRVVAGACFSGKGNCPNRQTSMFSVNAAKPCPLKPCSHGTHVSGIVAGRSASSFTAQIGTMKITEEISAMRTMGMDPDIFLMLPRVIALVIIMPLIVFFADMAALFGEMVIVKIHLGISYEQFLDRVYQHVEIRHILLGLLKAPLFGFLIAIIGCFQGLQVRSGTDIGKCTTKSVVDAIFWLIIVNAIISLISIQLGF